MKKSIIIISSIILILIVSFLLFYYLLSSSFGEDKDVKSTNLTNESMNELHLGDEITPSVLKKLKDNYGETVNDPDMAIFLSTEHSNAYKFYKFYAGVHSNNTVNCIVTEKPNVHTSKGISVGDSVVKVKNSYGEHFKSTLDEIGESITYIDQEQGVSIQFVLYDEKVHQIILTTI